MTDLPGASGEVIIGAERLWEIASWKLQLIQNIAAGFTSAFMFLSRSNCIPVGMFSAKRMQKKANIEHRDSYTKSQA